MCIRVEVRKRIKAGVLLKCEAPGIKSWAIPLGTLRFPKEKKGMTHKELWD